MILFFPQLKLSLKFLSLQVNFWIAGLHDCILLYAFALNETIATGGDPMDGRTIAQRMWNRTFQGGLTANWNSFISLMRLICGKSSKNQKSKLSHNPIIYLGQKPMRLPDPSIHLDASDSIQTNRWTSLDPFINEPRRHCDRRRSRSQTSTALRRRICITTTLSPLPHRRWKTLVTAITWSIYCIHEIITEGSNDPYPDDNPFYGSWSFRKGIPYFSFVTKVLYINILSFRTINTLVNPRSDWRMLPAACGQPVWND